MHSPAYSAEIEIWWAAPDRWRREIKSAAFTQTAVRHGARYLNPIRRTTIFPGVDQLATAAIDPIPFAALAGVAADEDRPECGNWETEHGTGAGKFSTYISVCFNYDGTANQLFAEPIGIELGGHEPFGAKLIARRLRVSTGTRSDATATVRALEPLPADLPASVGYSAGHFAVLHDTGLASRVRFVMVSESALAAAESPARLPLTWPSSYIFPLSGVIAVTAQIDRGGNVRELPFAISKNQGLHAGALAQIKNWKFKPYVVDGQPVEVVTTLSVPFHLKYEPFGASGKTFPKISLGEHIAGFHKLSDPRAAGSTPFVLHATVALADGTAGEYSESWQSPADFKRIVRTTGGAITQVKKDGQSQTAEQFSGARAAGLDMELMAVLFAMQDHFPEPRSFPEGDWGHSAVALSNIDAASGAGDAGPPELIRAARGGVDAQNRPISGQAYWFDAEGMLRADFTNAMLTVYSSFEAWKQKQVPRKIEVFKNGELRFRLNATSLEEQAGEPGDVDGSVAWKIR
jgi:Gram-negative bacterial TonB protein C-terminal